MSDDKQQTNEMLDGREGQDDRIVKEPLEHLHPSLRESFVPLPPIGMTLNEHQLMSVFGGDIRALSDVVRLVYQPEPFETDL